MKKLVFAILISLPILASAQLMTKPVYNCSSWSYNSQSGGYVCSSYPMSEYIVDANSLNYKIRELESRITELEKKINSIQ